MRESLNSNPETSWLNCLRFDNHVLFDRPIFARAGVAVLLGVIVRYMFASFVE